MVVCYQLVNKLLPAAVQNKFNTLEISIKLRNGEESNNTEVCNSEWFGSVDGKARDKIRAIIFDSNEQCFQTIQ